MATLQVKNLPDELHAGLRERASREGLNLSDYVTRLVRRDLRRPALNEWLDVLAAHPVRGDVDVVAVLDQVRDRDQVLVLDASAAVELLLGTERGRRVGMHLRDQSLVAPELLDVEVASAAARLERQAVLNRADADGVVQLLARLPVERLPHELLLAHAWSLRASIRIADAFYVACAQVCAAPLLTCDARLARTASSGAAVTVVS